MTKKKYNNIKNNAALLIGLMLLFQAVGFSMALETINIDSSNSSQWTAIYYLCGDNKLSASQQQHLNQIQSVGSTTEVSIAILIDQGDIDDTKLYYLDGNDLIEQSWESESDMGNPDTLRDFIQKAIFDLPAEHVFVQLSSNKGSGWQGVCYDQNGDGTMITMEEIADVFSDVTNSGSQKIDVIAIETCLGGNLEFAYQLHPYSNYYVGYADCGLVGAWPFQESIAALVDNPSMNPSDFVSNIVDFFTPQDIPAYRLKTAIGALDLSQISTVADSIDSLAGYLIENLDTYQTMVTTTFENIRIYGEMWDIDYYIDFKQFLIDFSCNDQEGVALKDNVFSSIDALVVNKKHLPEDDSEGFNFYFPRRSIDFNHALRYESGILPANYEETNFAKDTLWDDFLKSYLGIANNNAPNIPSINGPTSGKAGESYEYIISSDDPENDQIAYFIDWGDSSDSGWMGPYSSGDSFSISHSWTESDTYTIRVKAKDQNGAESDWKTLEINMPKSKMINYEKILTFLLGKITDIERNQEGSFRFLPINLIALTIGSNGLPSFQLVDETYGGYPCCCYIDESEFHGILKESFILGVWIT